MAAIKNWPLWSKSTDHIVARKAVVALLFAAMFGGADDDFIVDEPDIAFT